MFTGIIEATGKITSLTKTGGDLRAVISSQAMSFDDVKLGDSICVSGVCLTAVSVSDHAFTVDISNETIALTSFAHLKEGSRVNLEKAMQPSSRFGGHIVSGHVDGLAQLISRSSDGRSERLVFSVAPDLVKYIAAKGSVCLEGISLTVNEVNGSQFGVNIIPHTAEKTTLDLLQVGSAVNLEVDIISRYLESLMSGMNNERETETDRESGSDKTAGITLEKLARSGYIK